MSMKLESIQFAPDIGIYFFPRLVSGYFCSFMSTTRERSIAERFSGKNIGMLIEIDHKKRQNFKCADVSWISKFGDNENN